MEQCKVLIVNDSFSSRMVLMEACEELGCITTEAENGKIALDLLKENTFDLILMDIEMPVMNGYDTTRKIRNNLEYPKNAIPIVAVTAHEGVKRYNNYYKIAFNDVILKPYNIKKVQEVMKKLMQQNNTN